MTTQEEGLLTILSEKGDLIGVVYKDTRNRKNVFYKCEEMDTEDLKQLLGEDKAVVNNN